MANKSPLSIPSFGMSSSRTPSPLPKDVTQAIAAATAADESSESENETEPARIFQRRVSTSKNLSLNGSVSHSSNILLFAHKYIFNLCMKCFPGMKSKCPKSTNKLRLARTLVDLRYVLGR